MRSLFLIAALAVIVIPAALYLAPSRQEMALMQMNDAHYSASLRHYRQLYAEGDHSLTVLSPLIRLCKEYGDIDEATRLMQQFIREHPNSVEGYRELGSLYQAAQRLEDEARNRETLQRLAPSAENLRELADLLEFLGHYDRQRQALTQLIAHQDYTPREADYVTLARLERLKGHPAVAASRLQHFIRQHPTPVRPETLQLAVLLLLETDQDAAAFALAQTRLRQTHLETEAITLSTLFHQQGRLDAAYGLLSPFLHKSRHYSPDLLQQVTRLQLARGQDALTLRLLTRHFVDGRLPDALASDLIDLALPGKHYALAEQILSRTRPEWIPEDSLLHYAALAIQQRRPSLAKQLQQRLGAEGLRQDPVLAAVLTLGATPTPQAAAALLALPPRLLTQPERRITLASLYVGLGAFQQAFALLKDIPPLQQLANLDAPDYALLHLTAGQAVSARQTLQKLHADAPPPAQRRITEVFHLLDAGEGNHAGLRQWLADASVKPARLLADAQDLAYRFQQPECALMLATHLHTHDPSPANRRQWQEALARNHRYREAIASLTAGQQSSLAETPYRDLLTGWIIDVGQHPASPDADLTRHLESVLHRPEASPHLRELAYLLAANGLTPQAEAIFLRLAEGQPFQSPAVTELLGFWGAQPSPAALDWTIGQAATHSGREQAAWLTHLNHIGQSERVIGLFANARTVPATALPAYLDALVITHDKTRLKAVLNRHIPGNVSPAQLERFAMLAEQEALPDTAFAAWQQLYAINPQHGKATQALGMLAVSKARYTEAEKLLGSYLRDHTGDYRTHYLYAETLRQRGRPGEADRHFAEAARLLSSLHPLKPEQQQDEAALLYRNRRLPEAIALYRELLIQYPTSKSLRADFAELLLATRRFDEASRILGSAGTTDP